MKIQEINISINELTFYFSDEQKFNKNILVDTQHSFEQLDRFKKLIVKMYGPIPLEIQAYAIEVSNYCTMEIQVFDDYQGYSFMDKLKEVKSSNVKIKFLGESDGS